MDRKYVFCHQRVDTFFIFIFPMYIFALNGDLYSSHDVITRELVELMCCYCIVEVQSSDVFNQQDLRQLCTSSQPNILGMRILCKIRWKYIYYLFGRGKVKTFNGTFTHSNCFSAPPYPIEQQHYGCTIETTHCDVSTLWIFKPLKRKMSYDAHAIK